MGAWEEWVKGVAELPAPVAARRRSSPPRRRRLSRSLPSPAGVTEGGGGRRRWSHARSFLRSRVERSRRARLGCVCGRCAGVSGRSVTQRPLGRPAVSEWARGGESQKGLGWKGPSWVTQRDPPAASRDTFPSVRAKKLSWAVTVAVKPVAFYLGSRIALGWCLYRAWGMREVCQMPVFVRQQGTCLGITRAC